MCMSLLTFDMMGTIRAPVAFGCTSNPELGGVPW